MNAYSKVAPLGRRLGAARLLGLLAAVATVGTACTNPTIDPSSTFYAEGRALDASGAPLVGAEVRLIRYFHPAKLLRPSVDDLFSCNDAACGYTEVSLEIGRVRSTRTDMDGRFSMEFKGEDIAGQGGITDSTGKVEGSNLVLVVFDPGDDAQQAGVFTADHVFQQTDKRWDPGNLRLWDSGAAADVSEALNSGLVDFTWNKIDRPTGSQVSNVYRIEVRGGGSRLVVRCQDGVSMIERGDCISSGDKLQMGLSAYSIYTFYSSGGQFSAYIQGDGVDFRYRSKFTVSGTFQNPAADRDPIGVEGIWAVTPTQNQMLSGRAVDGDPKTREDIGMQAQAIYVRLPQGSLVTDAGLLNAAVKDAYNACVVLEFHGSAFNDVDGAKAQQSGWTAKGKFCGGQGADNEMSALVSFDTSSSSGESASWLRFRIEGAGSHFISVGEVAVLKKK